MASLALRSRRSCVLLSLGLATASACGSDDGQSFSTTNFGTTNDPSDTGNDPSAGEESGDTGDTGGPICGDGIVEGAEQCDLGPDNAESGSCTPLCTIAECGDGFVRTGFEDCDDGNAVETDACLSDCTAASCGDGFVHDGVELCDDGNDDEADGCNSMCLPGSCGDAVVQDGEQCDDGNRDTTDACPACQLAYCGDGYVEAGVEECDDGNQANDDDCLATFCTLATCGDGQLWAGVELCDDGNLDDDDACPSSCEPATCGDGFVLAGVEQCDDGNLEDGDGCTGQCEVEALRVFVTSEMYDGNLGGLAGADAKCQALADAAGLPGTYMAWISTAEGSPSTRFTQSTQPYLRIDGVQVAPNWAGLVDGTLDAAISVTELGGPAPIGNTSCAGGGFATVWSATNVAGGSGGTACAGFTSNAGSGLWGQATVTNSSWTSWCSGGLCSWLSPLYCFQQ